MGPFYQQFSIIWMWLNFQFDLIQIPFYGSLYILYNQKWKRIFRPIWFVMEKGIGEIGCAHTMIN